MSPPSPFCGSTVSRTVTSARIPALLPHGNAGRTAFREVVFNESKDKITQAIIDVINRERSGAIVDRTLLRKSVEIYEAMGEGTLEIYTEALQVWGV